MSKYCWVVSLVLVLVGCVSASEQQIRDDLRANPTLVLRHVAQKATVQGEFTLIFSAESFGRDVCVARHQDGELFVLERIICRAPSDCVLSVQTQVGVFELASPPTQHDSAECFIVEDGHDRQFVLTVQMTPSVPGKYKVRLGRLLAHSGSAPLGMRVLGPPIETWFASFE